MGYSNEYTEQGNDWSDRCPTRINGHATHAAAHDRQAPAHPHPAGDTRISDHAVHAVWQTALPVCDWTRAWCQILSFSEQSGETSPPHLDTPGEGGADSGAPLTAPHLSYPPGGGVRYRLRVAHATGRAGARTKVVGQPPGSGLSRCDCRQSTGGQYGGARRERWLLVRATTTGGTPGTSR